MTGLTLASALMEKSFPGKVIVLPLVLAAMLVAGSVRPVWADPVRLVTSGGVYQIPEDGETGATFQGSGFVFSPEFLGRTDFPRMCSMPCVPGSSVDLSATMTLSSLYPGTATVDGITHERVFFTGDLAFAAGTAIVPDVAVSQQGAASAGFTFTGTLAGYADATLSGTPLFTTGLTGRGTARVVFFNYPSSGGYAGGIGFSGFDYRFDDVAPTPEPGSLLLFGAGAAWLAARRRGARAAKGSEA